MASQSSSQVLTFKLSEQRCAIAISEIREIIEFPVVDPLPLAPHYVLGVTELRGSVVPILDLASRLQIANEPVSPRTCVVIIDADAQHKFGIKVDLVMQVVEIDEQSLEAAPEFEGVASDAILKGLARTDYGLIAFIDEQVLRHLVEPSTLRAGQEVSHEQ